MRRNNGFTLIELLLTAALISIIGVIIVGNFNRGGEKLQEEEIYLEKLRVVNFIQNTRENAVESKRDIEIIPDVLKNRFLLMSGGKLIKVMNLEKKFRLWAVNKKEDGYNLLSASKTGYMTPCTIIFKGENGREYFISIGVGKNYVKAK